MSGVDDAALIFPCRRCGVERDDAEDVERERRGLVFGFLEIWLLHESAYVY